MSADDGAALAELAEALDKVICQAPESTIAVAIIVDGKGRYEIVANGYRVTRPQVYQAVGLFEQAKIDLLASVPRNRPLREPEPTIEDDDEIDEPIGQA